MDAAELEALAESTALGLSRANQRLLDLEAQLTTHVGLDWGNQGLNYPHPNQNVSILEFGGSTVGGSVGRVYENGLYFVSNTASPWSLTGPIISWVNQFPTGSDSGHANTDDYALITGVAGAGAGSASLVMMVHNKSIGSGDYSADITMIANNTQAYLNMHANSSDAGQGFVYLEDFDQTDHLVDLTWDFNVVLGVAGQTRFQGIISDTLAANTNNWVPGVNPFNFAYRNGVRVDSSAGAINITGMVGGINGRILFLHNVDATDTITLTDEDALSTAANRFALPGGNMAIPPDGAVLLQYDATSLRWRCIGATPGVLSASYPAGHIIQDEGIALTQRSTINFVGAGVTATDSGGVTVVTIPQGYVTAQDEGVGLTQRNTINFVGTGVTASDLAGITTVTVPGGALDSANEFWLARAQQAGRGGVLA